jgi:hypothetical protein
MQQLRCFPAELKGIKSHDSGREGHDKLSLIYGTPN